MGILNDTKKLLGIAADYNAFDTDVIIFINSALGTLKQLDVGPAGGLMITDDSIDWDALATTTQVTSLCKSYVYLKVKMLFDPPTERFPIQAMEEQLAEMEWRIHASVDEVDETQTVTVTEPIRPLTPAELAYQQMHDLEEWWALLP